MFRRDLSKLKEEYYSSIKNDLNSVKWDKHLLHDKNEVNFSFNTFFFKSVEEIIDKYCPHEKMSKRKLKNKYKPWITKGIITSIKRGNKLFGKYIRSKTESRKATLYDELKYSATK